MTQSKALEEHLLKGHTVTSLDVIRICSTTSPTKRISEIRAKYGARLRDKVVQTLSGKRIKQYWIQPYPEM